MDLKLHLDFCFSIGADLVLAAGWTPRPQPEIVPHAGHASLSPLGVVRFARRDLRTLNRMGYLVLFDLFSEPGATDPSEDLFLGLGKEYMPIRQDRLATDLSKMVKIGVDEIFFSYGRMIALGTLPVPASDQGLSAPVINDLQISPEPMLPDVTDPPHDGMVLLLLDHDLDDVDLHHVLRRVTTAHDGTVLVHLLRPMVTEALQQALLGARREAACALRLSGCAMPPPDPADHTGQVVFARSSILFHVDPAPLLAPGTAPLAVTVLDPMAALPGGSDHTALTDRLVDGRLPFACAGPGAVVLAPFAHPTAYLTAEAVLRDLAARLLSAGTASLVAAPAQGFLAGNRGPCCQSLIDGVGWHDFDGLSAGLLTEAA